MEAPRPHRNSSWQPFHELIRNHIAAGTRSDGPDRTWTKQEFSHAIGVTIKTTNNWLRRGLPVSEDNLRGMLRVFFGDRPERAAQRAEFAAAFYRSDGGNDGVGLKAAAQDSGRKIQLGKLEQDLIGPHLLGRQHEEKLLDLAWADPGFGVFSIFGLAGCGKSALAIRWWRDRAALIGDASVLGYTFGHQGLGDGQYDSASFFLAHALREWFEIPEIPGNSFQAGTRLAKLIRSRRTLLILDGLETLQFSDGPRLGLFKDPGMTALLTELAAYNPGLCVCTSRLPLVGMREGTKGIELHDLTPHAGASYLRQLGVNGTHEDLRGASNEYGNHAFSLTNLAAYVNRVLGGDIRKRGTIPHSQGDPARRLMEAYEKWFEGKPEVEVLHLLGLFDRPADPKAVEGLRKLFPGISSSREWQLALAKCQELHLLHVERTSEAAQINCHPIVRAHFGQSLRRRNVSLWVEGHKRLFDYYRYSCAPPYPETPDEIAPLYVAITHGCRAGAYPEVLEVLQQRIWREGEGEGEEHYSGRTMGYYSERVLGLVSPDLGALACFYEEPWERLVPGLSPEVEASLLRDTAFRLRALGRFHEAVAPMNEALSRFVRLEDWDGAALTIELVIEIYLSLGDLVQARFYAEQALGLARRASSFYPLLDATALLAFILNKSGEAAETTNLLVEIQELLDRNQVASGASFHQLIGCAYCDILLERLEFAYVIDHATLALRIANEKSTRWLRAVGMHHWALGQALVQRAFAEGSDDFGPALVQLDNAVETLRTARQLDYVPYALLARADLHLQTGNLVAARCDLDEAFEIAEQSDMRLHLADCRLLCARLHIALGEHGEAQTDLAEARKLIAITGYHLRDAMTSDIETNCRQSLRSIPPAFENADSSDSGLDPPAGATALRLRT